MALTGVQDRERQETTAEMEWIVCDLCGANDTEIVYTRGRFKMRLQNVICKRCGLVYVTPRMSRERYDRFCLEEYRRVYGKPVEVTDDFRRMEKARGEEILAFVGKEFPEKGRILEIGCRTGDLLHLFRTLKGCEVYGVEPDRSLAGFGAAVLSLPVTQGLFESAEFPERFFDLIILCHVLEHSYSPTGWLEKVGRLLKPAGMVYLEVPNLDTPYGDLGFYFQQAHPYSFSPRTLQRLVEKTGFLIVRLKPKRPALQLLLEKGNRNGPVGADEDYRLVLRSLKSYEQRYRWGGLWLKDRFQGGMSRTRRFLKKWIIPPARS